MALTRREFVKFAAAGIAAAAATSKARILAAAGAATTQAATQATATRRKPNIVFIFADQMRFSAMGCMGNKDVKTPHLDKLAAQGMLFTHAFSCSPVCSPYRAQLLTGRYGHVNTVFRNDVKLPHDEVTIAEILRERSYSTAYIGKWHLEGGRAAPKDDPRKKGFVPPGPARQGFDYWAALECSHEYFKTWYFHDTQEPIPIDGYEPDVQTDLAIEYMKQNKDNPFLLMLSYGPPHTPLTPPDSYKTYDPAKMTVQPNVPDDLKESTQKQLALYYALITSLDDNMGRLMQTLDELKLADDTILCFSSDHGVMMKSHRQDFKQRPWEESSHIPFILRYPGHVQAGQSSDLLLNSVDVMPTLLGLSDVPVPKNVQGVDLSGPILGRDKTHPESLYLAMDMTGNLGPKEGAWRAVRTKDWLYAVHHQGEWLLHNVKDDPYEMKNLVDDASAQDQKARLRAMLLQWVKSTGDSFSGLS